MEWQTDIDDSNDIYLENEDFTLNVYPLEIKKDNKIIFRWEVDYNLGFASGNIDSLEHGKIIAEKIMNTIIQLRNEFNN